MHIFMHISEHIWSSFVGKLKKWDTVDEVHRTIDIPEAPKVGTSEKIKVDKSGIPLPPPPPPAHLLKHLHVETRNEKDSDARAGGSPVSSFYSPGKKYNTWRFPVFIYELLSVVVNMSVNFVLKYDL